MIDSLTTQTKLSKDEVVEGILKLAQDEHNKGNLSVTQDKLDNLSKYVSNYKERQRGKTKRDPFAKYKKEVLPPPSLPLYPPLYDKFKIEPKKKEDTSNKKKKIPFKFTFKNLERILVEVLETLANVLDNLHLFSMLPMFPKNLTRLLQHTNKLWVLILVFLIRKTISQLLNVIRKERKVNVELGILKTNKNSQLLDTKDDNENNIFRKYEKVLKDLRFDRMMLILELIGNSLDMSFNLIELYRFDMPEWFMSTLNFASMAMTIYRMNKDDEYIDDDISEDLI